jgi:predicted ABC-type ATPase
LKSTAVGEQPVAIVLAGHNGSGKSTLWYRRLADTLQIPLVNADRLTLSLLPEPDADHQLRPWASRLRDGDQRWHKLAQDGVQLFMGLAMDQGMPFAFETVFSHLQERFEFRRFSEVHYKAARELKGRKRPSTNRLRVLRPAASSRTNLEGSFV